MYPVHGGGGVGEEVCIMYLAHGRGGVGGIWENWMVF